jgi:hypothetical protein
MVIIMMVPPVYVTKEREKNQEIAAAAGQDQPSYFLGDQEVDHG